MRKPKTAIILAGGLGTRLRSVVDDRPKPMADIDGRPFLAHQLSYWSNQGIERFVLSVGYMAQHIIQYFGEEYCGARITYAVETAPMGTGGAIKTALSGISLGEPIIVMNGDTSIPINLTDLHEFGTSRRAGVVMCLFTANELGRYMAVTVKENDQIDFSKRSHVGENYLANAGVYWFAADVTRLIISYTESPPYSFEKSVVGFLAEKGVSILGHVSKAPFLDIGVPADYSKARSGKIFLSE